MQQLILIVHVLVAIAIVALVLVQHGKGADVGAAFGSGSANTMFGSQGHMPFLMKLTSVLAIIFFATSLSLSYMSSNGQKQAGTLSNGGIQQPLNTPLIPKK
ncbi:MAG: preprotein translocase subunit SecG [Coxiellaceae bacterium]|nr:preprotein translocase subunit SecG [Coxiellaceae bacterium]